MGLHCHGHAAKILRQHPHLILGSNLNTLAVISRCNMVGSHGKVRQRPKSPANDPGTPGKPQKADAQCQQRKPSAELPQLGIDAGSIRHKIHLADVSCQIHCPSLNQIVPAICMDTDCPQLPTGRKGQIQGGVNGCGSTQALTIRHQDTAGNAAGTKAVGQIDPSGNRGHILQHIVGDALKKRGSQCIHGSLAVLGKGLIGLLPHQPEHRRRQAHRNRKQQNGTQRRQFCFQLHRSSNR